MIVLLHEKLLMTKSLVFDWHAYTLLNGKFTKCQYVGTFWARKASIKFSLVKEFKSKNDAFGFQSKA